MFVVFRLQFLKLFDELVQGVEAILAAGHMGVIVQLAESCAESGEKQQDLMQWLLNVGFKTLCSWDIWGRALWFHVGFIDFLRIPAACPHRLSTAPSPAPDVPAASLSSCPCSPTRCTTNLKQQMAAYRKRSEIDIICLDLNFPWHIWASLWFKSLDRCPCFSVCWCFQVPLTICYLGSMLVQALAKFKEHSILLSSLRTLSPADLLTLASDPAGSHVLQAFIITCSDKGRGKILKRLEVLHVHVILSLKNYTKHNTRLFLSSTGTVCPDGVLEVGQPCARSCVEQRYRQPETKHRTGTR